MITGLPVITETTFSVPANGEAGPSKLSDLINQYRQPMWVDEIRISAAGYSNFFSIFSATQIRILFGRYAITHDFVPGGVLAPRWPGDGHIVIRLHKPLYITPQDLPVPTVRSTVALTIRFALVGRLATAPLPSISNIWVPYITAFPGTTVPTGTVSSQQSKRTDLANPFQTPFTVRSFIGRRTAAQISVLTGLANNSPPMNVRMSNHLGRPIVRDPTPFFDLFNIRDQAWGVNVVMEPGGFFIANVDVDATDATEDQLFNIGMFGYREEKIQWS